MAIWKPLKRKPVLIGFTLAITAAIMIPIVVVLTHLALMGMGNAAPDRPNIVFIMTDDQDKRLNSLAHMPVLQRELVAKGTEFTNHYTNQALCCPSRSTILRGQTVRMYSSWLHDWEQETDIGLLDNTNLTNVSKPGYVRPYAVGVT